MTWNLTPYWPLWQALSLIEKPFSSRRLKNVTKISQAVVLTSLSESKLFIVKDLVSRNSLNDWLYLRYFRIGEIVSDLNVPEIESNLLVQEKSRLFWKHAPKNEERVPSNMGNEVESKLFGQAS